MNVGEQIVSVTRLGEERYRSSLHCSIANLLVGKRGQQDSGDRVAQSDQSILQLQPIHPGHPHVQDYTSAIAQTVRREEFCPRCECEDCESERFHHASHRLSNRLVVIHDRNYSCVAHADHPTLGSKIGAPRPAIDYRCGVCNGKTIAAIIGTIRPMIVSFRSCQTDAVGIFTIRQTTAGYIPLRDTLRWQRELEHGSVQDTWRHPDASIVRFDDRTTNRQPHACSLGQWSNVPGYYSNARSIIESIRAYNSTPWFRNMSAVLINSASDFTRILPITWRRWTLAVTSPMPIVPPICLLE